MISSPPDKGAVRIYMDPGSIDTSHGGITADTFQGVATLITSTDPFKMEGARWHLLSQVFSSSEGIREEIQRERLIQEKMDKDPTCRSFSWKVLRSRLQLTLETRPSRHLPSLIMRSGETRRCGDPEPGVLESSTGRDSVMKTERQFSRHVASPATGVFSR